MHYPLSLYCWQTQPYISSQFKSVFQETVYMCYPLSLYCWKTQPYILSQVNNLFQQYIYICYPLPSEIRHTCPSAPATSPAGIRHSGSVAWPACAQHANCKLRYTVTPDFSRNTRTAQHSLSTKCHDQCGDTHSSQSATISVATLTLHKAPHSLFTKRHDQCGNTHSSQSAMINVTTLTFHKV